MEREVFEKELEDLGLAPRGKRLWQHAGPDVTQTVTFQSGESLPVTLGDDAPKKEFYDPNNSGNPLLDVSPRYRETKLSEHFKVKELTQSGGKPFYKARIDPELVNCLEDLRKFLGRSIKVIDGYYSYKYLEDLFKSGRIKRFPENSPHLSGQGSKIGSDGVDGFTLAKAALFACYGSSTRRVEVSLGETSIALYVDRKERKLSSYIRDGEVRDKLLKKLQQYRALYHDDDMPEDITKGLTEGMASQRRVNAMKDFVHRAIHVKGVQDELIIAEVLFYKTDFIQKNLRDRGGVILDMRNNKDSAQIATLLKEFVRPALSKVQGPLEQQGGEPKTSKAKFQDAKPMPEYNPKLDITGRYELIYQKTKRPALGRFMGVNQAGKHVEVIHTNVLSPKEPSDKQRQIEKLNGNIQNDGSYLLLSRENRTLHHKLIPTQDGFKVYWNSGKNYDYFTKYSSTPILRERALESYENLIGNSPAQYFVSAQEWNPLLSNQMYHLLKFFGDARNVDKYLKDFFTMPNFVKSREHHHGTAAKKFDDAIMNLVNDADNGIHPFDSLQARHYIQLLLSKKSWKFADNWPDLTQLGGIHRMVSIVEQEHKSKSWDNTIPYNIKNIQKWIIGPAHATEPNVFGITFVKSGGQAVIGGYYRGDIIIEKLKGTKWHPDPLKYPDGKVRFKFNLFVGGVGGGVAWKSSYYATVSTQDDWLPEDFPGSLLIGGGEAGAQLVIAGGSAEVFGLLIFGSAHFGPLSLTMGDVDIGLKSPVTEKDDKTGKKKIKKFDYGWGISGGWGRISEKDEPISTGTPPPKVEKSYGIDYGIKKEAHFEFDSDELGDSARQALRVMCALELPALKSPMTKLEIRGHTDSKGPGTEEEAKEYNRRLSMFRARNTRQAIKDILNNSLGVLDANFTANGYGWDEAVKAGEKNFRNLDRRKVEILLDGHLVLTLYDGKW